METICIAYLSEVDAALQSDDEASPVVASAKKRSVKLREFKVYGNVSFVRAYLSRSLCMMLMYIDQHSFIFIGVGQQAGSKRKIAMSEDQQNMTGLRIFLHACELRIGPDLGLASRVCTFGS